MWNKREELLLKSKLAYLQIVGKESQQFIIERHIINQETCFWKQIVMVEIYWRIKDMLLKENSHGRKFIEELKICFWKQIIMAKLIEE